MDNSNYNMIKPVQNVGPLTSVDRRNGQRKGQSPKKDNTNEKRPSVNEPEEPLVRHDKGGDSTAKIDYCA